MKQKHAFLLLIFGLFLGLSACNNTDFDQLQAEQNRQDSLERARIQKLLDEQAPLLEAYVHTQGWTNAILNKDRGIWYEVLNVGTNDSYAYKINYNGTVPALVYPNIEVMYKGELLDGTPFDETADGKTATLSLNRVLLAWQLAFFPKSIYGNGQNNSVGGLTEKGLQKGAKIRFVTPSPWAYDAEVQDKIPANSPLVFEIEVVNITD